ncbi:MAG: bifunctional oligoribonuclease/PAP phosphatase NrnA [Armatimonadota bacterium]|nr:bifunctional oligoribonuclease/PAP phosphatase NrnA [Armatimonadota bacterium]MDW8155429.1 bifunctional oligoribonuclease/PAP phosphatase NrnA [Armatimonadota bacterium]
MKEQVASALRAARRVLVACHESPDGDCLGGGLALRLSLERAGKQAVVASTDGVPEVYRFLPGWETVVHQPEGLGRFDVAVALECPDLQRAGRFAEALAACPVLVNLDHHRDNAGYGHVVWQDPEAASVCEMVYQALQELGAEVDEPVATCLMAGLLTDTGSFRYSSVRAQTFELAAELVRRGARPDRIYERVYEWRPVAAVRLLGMALERLQLAADGQVAWSVVDEDMLARAGARWEDTENIVETLRSIAGVRLAVLFKVESRRVKVSLRAREGAQANRVAVRFGGGGHLGAAGFVSLGSLEQVVRDTLEAAAAEVRASTA